MQKVIAKINLGHIRNNAAAFASLTKRKLIAVVKANAYGHGAEETVNALSGVSDGFAVALIEEGVAIRQAACGKEILVFTPPTDEEEVFLLAANGFSATVGDLWTARLVAAVCERHQLPLNVHLKINTGMNRYGMNISALGKVCKFLQGNSFVRVRGIYSHLAECSFVRAEKQREIFSSAVMVCKRYFSSLIAHLGGTYGALLGEEFLFDAVRVGIGLYGYLPCQADLETGVKAEIVQGLRLEKGMAVYAKTVLKRKYTRGSVGYGKELSADAELKSISVCRFGYADGFLRTQANGTDTSPTHASHLCMDVCLRKKASGRGVYTVVMTDADRTAKETETISYEVLCAATRRAEFVYE